ncbi:MAG: methyltransferase domain-containing protein [Pseudorhodoplanes sp.]
MRRDERAYDASEGEDEIAAIETQWTRAWEAQGGPQGRTERILRREEFKILREHLKTLPKGSRLLDGGCGMGDWVVWLTRAGYPTLGLDVSRLTIGKLQTLFPEMEFAVGDIRKTGLPDASVDLYFSWGTFEHFEEGFGPVVSEAFRVIKPGGVLLTSMPFFNLRLALRDVLLEKWRLPPQRERTRFYQWRPTRAELATILARHGFAVDDVKIIHKREGLQRWLKHNFGFDPASRITKGIAVLLYPFVPKILIGHMILAIARKPLA